MGEESYYKKAGVKTRDSSQPCRGWTPGAEEAKSLFWRLGRLAPLCSLNRPQGDVSANALPEREGAAGRPREAPGIAK